MKSKLNQLKSGILLSLVVLLFACNKNPDHSPIIEKEINVNGFNKVYAGDRFNVTITKGTAFYVKATGPGNSVNDITWSVANNILDIGYAHQESNRPVVDIVITLPSFVSLNLSGAATGAVNGFHGTSNVLRAVLSGASKCTFNGTGVNMQIDISGASELNINGSTESLYGNISGAGKLIAFDLIATEVDINASGGSEASVYVTHKLFAEATGGSRIYYKGTPHVKNIVASGGGKVIQN